MRRPDIDAWFAKADGMLSGWHGSPDAMHVRTEPDDADPELPLLGDNSADQTWPLPRRRPSPRGSTVTRLRRALTARIRS